MFKRIIQTWVGKGLLISFGLTFLIYILRGVGILSMMPGYILLGLIAITLGFALLLSFQR